MSEFSKPIDLAHRVLDIETTAIDTAILARAVLAQHEEIERLRSLAMSADEALEIEGESDTDHRAVARKLGGEVRQLRALLADARECIADRGQLVADRMQLRAALDEALDAIEGVENAFGEAGREPIALSDARIAELRAMARTR